MRRRNSPTTARARNMVVFSRSRTACQRSSSSGVAMRRMLRMSLASVATFFLRICRRTNSPLSETWPKCQPLPVASTTTASPVTSGRRSALRKNSLRPPLKRISTMSKPAKESGTATSASQSNMLRRVQPLLQPPLEPQPPTELVEQPPPDEQVVQAMRLKIYIVGQRFIRAAEDSESSKDNRFGRPKGCRTRAPGRLLADRAPDQGRSSFQ